MKPAHARPEHTIALSLSKCRRGFALVVVLVVAALVIGVDGTVAYFKLSQKPTPSPASYQSPETSNQISSPSPSAANETANLKTYTNAKYKLSLKLPGTFVIDTENQILDTATESTVLESADFAEDKSECRGGCAYPVTKGWKLQIGIQREWTRGFDADFFRISPPLKVTREEEKTINGLSMFVTERNAPDLPNIGNSELHAQFVNEGKFYRIVFRANKIQLGNSKDIFNQILSTFQFLD